MCLNLPTQTNACSLAWVLKCGFSFFSLSGLKFFLHSGDIWFAKWNTSITFSTLDQDKSSGGGSGRGLWATFSLAKLHMLSYANVTWGICWELFSRANNCSTNRNTWDKDSDLHLERSNVAMNTPNQPFNYKGLNILNVKNSNVRSLFKQNGDGFYVVWRTLCM